MHCVIHSLTNSLTNSLTLSLKPLSKVLIIQIFLPVIWILQTLLVITPPLFPASCSIISSSTNSSILIDSTPSISVCSTYSTWTRSTGFFHFLIFHELKKNTMVRYTLIHFQSIEICHNWEALASSPLYQIHFPFFKCQDEASTMPGIYLKCSKNICDKPA